MWLKAGRWVGTLLSLVLGGQMTAEELLYVAEGGPVGRLSAPALEHELEQLSWLL